MAAQQIRYLNLESLKGKPYNTPNWIFGIEQAYGFETNGEAQAVRAQYKDASGVIEGLDGRWYVMKVPRD